MPRKSKDETNLDNSSNEKKINKNQKIKTSATKNAVTTSDKNKKSSKDASSIEKKSSKKSTAKKASFTSSTSKANTTKASTKKVESKKKTTAKSTSKNIEKKSNVTSSISSTTNKTKKQIELIEYYDLPYSYNKTVIKLLAQTPTSLFVYFEISDDDKKDFIAQYGTNFFSETKPVLIVHNETMNYTFEVEINDFANCWYFHVNDAKCKYDIKLARKYLNTSNNEFKNYIYVTSSNELESPNDHILFNNINNMVYFKNVKNNNKIQVKISDILTIKNIGKIYNIYDLYKKIYSKENIEDFDFKNPSSTLPSSSF